MPIFPSIIIHRTAVVHVSTDLTNGPTVLHFKLQCTKSNANIQHVQHTCLYSPNSAEQNEGAPFMVF